MSHSLPAPLDHPPPDKPIPRTVTHSLTRGRLPNQSALVGPMQSTRQTNSSLSPHHATHYRHGPHDPQRWSQNPTHPNSHHAIPLNPTSETPLTAQYDELSSA
jgi:hypothetical protein